MSDASGNKLAALSYQHLTTRKWEFPAIAKVD
jgi:hypothetical protein